jgi:hypothetical protein
VLIPLPNVYLFNVSSFFFILALFMGVYLGSVGEVLAMTGFGTSLALYKAV